MRGKIGCPAEGERATRLSAVVRSEQQGLTHLVQPKEPGGPYGYAFVEPS